MTEENQKKLYEHFSNIVANPDNIKGHDKTFILKQATEQKAELERVYPQFTKVEETKSKGKK